MKPNYAGIWVKMTDQQPPIGKWVLFAYQFVDRDEWGFCYEEALKNTNIRSYVINVHWAEILPPQTKELL
jgi:hypothetical protein